MPTESYIEGSPTFEQIRLTGTNAHMGYGPRKTYKFRA